MEAKIWAVGEEAASGLHWINGHLSVNKSWCRTVGEALRPQTNMIRAINKTPKLGWGGGVGSPLSVKKRLNLEGPGFGGFAIEEK